jgi:ADP-heptose:LPS heptosyltransferase
MFFHDANFNLLQPIKVLVRRKAALGDVILSTGLVREIYKRFHGKVIIDVATDFPRVFDNNPYVSTIIPITPLTKNRIRPIPFLASKERIYKVIDQFDQSRNYDLTINLDGAYEWNVNNSIVDSYFYRVFGEVDFNKVQEIFHSEDDSNRYKLSSIFSEKYIVVHMRNWYLSHKNIDIKIWREFLDIFLSAYLNFSVVVIGSDNDFFIEGNPRILDFRSVGSLGFEKLIIQNAKLFIGSNTGSLHLAGTTDVPILALMSDMSAHQVAPYRTHLSGNYFRALYPNLSCVGCWNRQEIPVKQVICERDDFACNRMLRVADIFSVVKEMLATDE